MLDAKTPPSRYRPDWMFVFACAIYNLVRLRALQETAT
jgi:hypothetical protein